MPSTRYAEIAPRVKEICERYGLPYNSGPFFQQVYMVNRTIARLAFPGGAPRPKPGPYHGVETNGSGPAETPDAQARQARGEHASGPEQGSDGVRVEMPESS
jgi:linoleoyl-CoA desaturase